MAPKIEAIGATLGAVITNINLENVTQTDWQLIDEAFDDYALLVFPDQFLSEDAQVDFSEHFGEIEMLTKIGRA